MAGHGCGKPRYPTDTLTAGGHWSRCVPGGVDFLALWACFINGQSRLHDSEKAPEKEIQVLWPRDPRLVCAEAAKAQEHGWHAYSPSTPGRSPSPASQTFWQTGSFTFPPNPEVSPASFVNTYSFQLASCDFSVPGIFSLPWRLRSASSLHLIPEASKLRIPFPRH